MQQKIKLNKHECVTARWIYFVFTIYGDEREIMDSYTNTDLKEDIIKTLDCLLDSEGRKCDACKKCEDVDVCCFLTDAVIVYKHKGRKKSNSVL